MDMVWKDRRHNQKSTAVARVIGIGGREGVRSDENDIHGWVWRVATLCGTVWGGRCWTMMRCSVSVTSLLATGKGITKRI
jgi:hypothetical protein